jgi:hypothetical protein
VVSEAELRALLVTGPVMPFLRGSIAVVMRRLVEDKERYGWSMNERS